MLIPLKNATLAQLKEFADSVGLDTDDIKTGLQGLAQLRARITASGLLRDGQIKIAEPKATPPPAAPEPVVPHIAEEVLEPNVFERIASALWTTAARKEGDLYHAPEIKYPTTDRAELMRLAVAYREATRTDPRNPFPGRAHGDKIKMLIPMEDPNHVSGGDLPIFVNYNEKSSQIARGEVVEIEWETACAIHQAQRDAIKVVDGVVQITGKIQNFPYQVLA